MRFTIRVSLALAMATVPSCVWAGGLSSYSDGTFNLADWSITRFMFGNGGMQTESQLLTGGNPDAYLEITNTVFNATTGFSRILGAYLKNNAVYNPQGDGAISHINYSEQALLISGFGNGQGIRPALKQGSDIYLGPLLTSPDFSWTPKQINGLTSNSFYLAPEVLSVHPDFSATGLPITFGFARLTTTPSNGFTIIGGIDNWRVDVVSVPEPASCSLSLLALALGIRVARRKRS